MSDPKVEVKKDAGDGSSGGFGMNEVKAVSKFFVWSVLIFFVVIAVVLIVFLNPSTAEFFIRFLQALQVIFVIIIVFCFFKLQQFRKKFLASCHDIDHIFADKNGQGHGSGGHGAGHDEHSDEHAHDDHKPKVPTNLMEEKLYKAIGHINSQFKEEWKIGLVELDIILKTLLIKKNYTGSTVLEMLEDAKIKGFKYSDDAKIAHKTKTYLLRDITKLPEDKDVNNYKNVLTLYRKIINELMH